MQMDNSDFKKKAEETTTLFGKLRDSLNRIPGISLSRTTHELTNINDQARSTNLNGLADAVQNISSRFSNLGVVATTVLANITNRATNAGINLSRALTIDQISDGFREYEMKIGSIGTMLANTEWAGTNLGDVKKTLGELNDYADNTIYNFSEMTSSIGRFTAAGVTLEDSAIAIKGLGNLAAVSGSNSEQLNIAMYQMSQALAAGKLNLMDWNSMVNAGMGGKKTQDALVATAKAMGKNIDLSDGFRNSIEQGWLTSEVFLATLKKFGEDESMTKAATSVRTFTGMMASLKEGIGSGWAETWEIIFGDFEEATTFWTKISNNLSGWFKNTSDARNKLLKGVSDKGGIQNIFDGIINTTKPVVQTFKAIREAFRDVFPPKSVDQIVEITENFKNFTAGLELSTKTTDTIKTAFKALFSVFKTGIDAFVVLGSAITAIIDIVGNFGSAIRDNLGKTIDWIKDKLSPVGKFLKDTFGGGFGGDELVGAGMIAGLTLVITKIVGLFDSFGDITDGFSEAIEGVGDALQNFALGIKITNLMLIAVAVGILAASLKTLEGIKTEDITKGITALAVSLGIMIGGMAIIDKFNVTGGIRASISIVALATAVLIMASALKKLSGINPEEMKKAISGLVIVTASLVGAVITISKWGGKIGAGSLQLIALAGAVYILASAVKTMSSIEVDDLKKSVITLGIIFGELAIFLKLVNGTKFGITSAVGVLAIAGALQLMISAVREIGSVDINELKKGLTSIAIILAQLIIFSHLVGGPTLLVAGAGILLIAGAINALVDPIQSFASMSLTELAKGLGAMAVALLAIAGASALMSGGLSGALAITIMAGALNLLMIPIKTFANMTWGELAKGFIGLAGGLSILAGASLLLIPAVPSMLAFGAGLLIMGAAMLAAGAGVALFGTGLATLATMTAASIAAIVSTLSLLLQGLAELIPSAVRFLMELGSALISGIGKLVPQLVETIVVLIVKLLDSITEHLPRFLELGVTLIVQLIEGIGSYVPILVDEGVKAIISLIQGLSDAIRDNGPLLTSTILELLGEIIILVIDAGVQVVDALFGWIPGVKSATSKIGSSAEKYIRENFGAGEAGKDKGKEFAKFVESTKGAAESAGKKVGVAAKDGVSSVKMTTVGKNFGEGFASGISGSLDRVVGAAQRMANAAAETVRSWLDIHSPSRVTEKLGEHTGEGFAKGIDSKQQTVSKSAKKAAEAAKKGFNEALDQAEYKFEMGEIDSTKYIAELNKIKSIYYKYPELVRKVNLEIKEIEEQASKDRDEIRRQEFEASKKWIDARKYYNEMSLTDELEAWERVSKKYDKGTDERADAEREIYRIKNDINRRLIDINNDYVSKVQEANRKLIDGERQLNDEYERALNDRVNSLSNFVGLFDKVQDPKEITGQQLIDNLRGQVDTFADWSLNIKRLANKGIDEGLLEELRQMGPQAASEIAALNTLTSDQLVEYSSLWQQKSKLAREEATVQLEGLKRDTQERIQELRQETREQLETYKNEWLAKIKEIKEGTSGEFVDLNTSMTQIGTDAIKGLMAGMNGMKGPLMAQAKSIANTVSNTIKSALKIKSPSRVTEELGGYTVQGFIDGIANDTKRVGDGAKKLATTAKDSLNKFLDGFEFDEGDNELHFKAVIDYDAFDVNHFGNVQPIRVVPDTSLTNGLITAVKYSLHQNDDNMPRNNVDKISDNVKEVDNSSDRPIIIQSILNGRIIAEETFNDTNQLLNNRTNLDYSMKGV